jgi:hypothetical protein
VWRGTSEACDDDDASESCDDGNGSQPCSEASSLTPPSSDDVPELSDNVSASEPSDKDATSEREGGLSDVLVSLFMVCGWIC